MRSGSRMVRPTTFCPFRRSSTKRSSRYQIASARRRPLWYSRWSVVLTTPAVSSTSLEFDVVAHVPGLCADCRVRLDGALFGLGVGIALAAGRVENQTATPVDDQAPVIAQRHHKPQLLRKVRRALLASRACPGDLCGAVNHLGT